MAPPKRYYIRLTTVAPPAPSTDFDSADFVWSLIKLNSTYTGDCVRITDGVSSVDIGFTDGPSEEDEYLYFGDGLQWVDAAALAASGLEDADGHYHIEGIYDQNTGVYLSQRDLSVTVDPIRLVLNSHVSEKPAIWFPGTGDNGLHDDSATVSLDNFATGGATVFTHMLNSGDPLGRRIWSKGASDYLAFVDYSTLQLGVDRATTDSLWTMAFGVPPFSETTEDIYCTITVKIDDTSASNTAEFDINGEAWENAVATISGSGMKSDNSASKFCWGAGASGATDQALGGYATTLAIWKDLIE